MKKIYGIFALLVLMLVIAACGSDSSSDQSGEDQNDDGTNSGEEGNVEIFSWWTGAAEEEGLLALIELFVYTYPDIIVENASVACGAGTNATAVLLTRLQSDDPPSTFQVHGGEYLKESWVASDKMEPLIDFY